MSDIDKIVLLLQKQHEEVRSLLLSHKREVIELLIKAKEEKK